MEHQPQRAEQVGDEDDEEGEPHMLQLRCVIRACVCLLCLMCIVYMAIVVCPVYVLLCLFEEGEPHLPRGPPPPDVVVVADLGESQTRL